jgi:hypothetical protein
MRSGLTRETAGELVLKVADALKGRPRRAPYDDIRQFYDLVRHKPLPAFEKAYLKVKETLSAFGLDFT